MITAPRRLANANDLAAALARIAQWRGHPSRTLECPLCGAPGLVVVDRSARPHAELYHLSCARCGLDDNVNVPLAGHPGGGGPS